MKFTNKTILLLILIVASALRIYNIFSIPFSHDEFSALSRLNFNSFSELIAKGVKIDGHPALVQVFLYYWMGSKVAFPGNRNPFCIAYLFNLERMVQWNCWSYLSRFFGKYSVYHFLQSDCKAVWKRFVSYSFNGLLLVRNNASPQWKMGKKQSFIRFSSITLCI